MHQWQLNAISDNTFKIRRNYFYCNYNIAFNTSIYNLIISDSMYINESIDPSTVKVQIGYYNYNTVYFNLSRFEYLAISSSGNDIDLGSFNWYALGR